ncbi:porin [Jannaschia pagri]|uniref:Porin n=1 Tax=Jannaschia pagri TaxID=2829797 RepID=A0ABQ4NQ38_9RHOB|nr:MULTISPECIES: porin [unclassified Jannaschia]GIT92657.1 porin [Jannaschia sp. AI_61]GIT96483.1 porin [Jannaschia sp. AI_62]
MKSILFASTALVAFAGAAAAQGVTLTGSAEMGIFDNDNPAQNVQFHTDIDVTFTLSGETDNGLTFGANIDLDESIGDNNDDDGLGESAATRDDSQHGGAVIFISGNFGTLTMGDTDGALDWALQEVLFNSGSLQDNEEHGGYNGNAGLDGDYDGQILRYDNTFGAFGVAVSAEISDADVANDDPILGLGLTYDLDLGGTAIGFGLGYQTRDDDEAIGLSIDAAFANGFAAGISYEDQEISGNAAASYDHVGIGVGYTTGAISLHANYGKFDFDNGSETDGFGLTAGYDLGGGASIQFGYGSTDAPGTAGDLDTFSLGVAMSF